MVNLTPTLADEEVYGIIFERIKTNTPFCLTRFGDGEIYFLKNNVPIELQYKVCKLWNKDFSTIYNMVNGILQRSLIGSDMIGLLNKNNPICKTLQYDINKWSIPSYMTGNNCPMICDHQIVRGELLGNINSFKNLLQGKSLNIISPNSEELQQNQLGDLLQSEVNYTKTDNNRDKMLHDILNIKEDVILYGVSLLGKDIGVILKSHGKIVLDYGATLDAWAGLNTRPWFSTLQRHCFIKNYQ